MNYLLPFLSVAFGFAFVVIFKPSKNHHIKLLLSFSGAYLLALTVFTLLPEVYHSHEHHHHDYKRIGLYIVSGILLQIILEFFSKGAEHGHVHKHSHTSQAFPFVLFASLSIHSILEGFPLAHNHTMVYGIFVHHLPIAIVLSAFLINSGISVGRTAVFLLLFALMTPFGTFLSNYVPFLGQYHTEFSAIVIGILLHISTIILFESSEGHKFNSLKLASIIVGFVIAYLT
ncbi:MAG: ZIP family metal transporter [Capnocytophaga sp.]|nr:ZIP family metal transporter [Capnocytophaga sp.]